MSIIAIILSLGLLIYLAYRGWSVIIIAPLLALLAALLSGLAGDPVHLLATYTQEFMPSLGGYVTSNFPMFLLGAIFGKVMDDTGSAKAIAEWFVKTLGKGKEIWTVVLACGVVTYGGVSLFVAAFAIYPIGAALYRESNLPKRLLPPAIALGAFTFTMTAIPGTPQIQNTIPMKYFGTDSFAAPILGVIAALIMFFGGCFWLKTREKAAVAKGEGYGVHANDHEFKGDESNLPSAAAAFIPPIAVIIANIIFTKVVFTDGHYDGAYLETLKEDIHSSYVNTTLAGVRGSWSVYLALLIGIILTIVLNMKRFPNGIMETLKDGVSGSFLAIMNTATEVGYGNVIKTLAGFAVISKFLTETLTNPLVGGTVAASGLAGITGSASGGMSIALEAFGETFMQRCIDKGIDPAVLHRCISVGSGGFDTLPHNGAVITLLNVTGMTHRESYVNIGMCTVVIPTIAAVVIIILGSMGIV
ncbi:MAG: GntP family permease [Firmicutes bacterium]|nr:GntP family permease [Bacillota bacterium]